MTRMHLEGVGPMRPSEGPHQSSESQAQQRLTFLMFRKGFRV